MHILGVAGLRRRIPDITATAFEKPLLSLNQFITISALTLGTVQIIFLVNFFISLFRGKPAGRNPWNSNTLEWATTSPAPHGNFDEVPNVYRWPYDYGQVEGQAEDHAPQAAREAPPGIAVTSH
jgi:cytochrome c oxidase subunit I